MSIANEITNYANGLSDAYDAVNDMQGIIPTDKNMNNLDTAIRTIPQSQGSTYTAGDGIDITNDVISATNTGLAKLLTTADRNWNTTTDSPDSQNPNAIAAWLLPPGIYYVDSSTGYAYVSRATSPMTIVTPMDSRKIYIVTSADSTQGKSIIELGNLANNDYEFGMIRKYGNDTTGVPIKYMYVGKPIDSLTSSDASFPLSAKQGKILKDLIDSLVVKNAGAPTTSTAGTVGKLYEDTTNGKLYICTDATNPYVWEEVGGGATYTAGNGINIDANNEISIDDTVVAEVSDLPTDFTGATSSTAGANGLVPAPSAGDEDKVLKGDGTWGDVQPGMTTYFLANDLEDYVSSSNSFSIYKDASLTTAVTSLEFNEVATGGPVQLVYSNSSSTEYYRVGFAFDNTDSYQMYDEMSYDIYELRTCTIYTIEDLGNDSFKMLGLGKQELQRKLTAGSNISIDSITNTISATDTTYSNFTGATSSVAGANGLVPAPAAGDEAKALHGDGTWKDTTAKLVEMSYGEANSWAKFIAAYNAGSIVYCRASSNANPATGSQTRKAFMAYVNNATSPTSVEFQYVRSQSSKTASQQFDQVFVYKLTNSNGGTWTVESRDMGPKIVAGTGMSSTFTTGANATITLNAEPDYSTSEVDTKVKWVDGKTIYRKTINFGALPNAATKTVAHNISNLYRVIKYECMAYNSTSGNNTQIPLVSTVGNNSNLDINSTDVIMNTTTDRSSFDECYITLYYTKSS